MARISPFLWYAEEAEQAAAFYASLFPDSAIRRVTSMPIDTPAGPPGAVRVVEFTLLGREFAAMTAGPMDPFNHAISLVVTCDSQEEIDRYWDALLDGGVPEECGWLRDRWGVCWQIVPGVLDEMIASTDIEAATRAATAMMSMVKLDIAALQAAFDG